jgi:hypothetical protein
MPPQLLVVEWAVPQQSQSNINVQASKTAVYSLYSSGCLQSLQQWVSTVFKAVAWLRPRQRRSRTGAIELSVHPMKCLWRKRRAAGRSTVAVKVVDPPRAKGMDPDAVNTWQNQALVKAKANSVAKQWLRRAREGGGGGG